MRRHGGPKYWPKGETKQIRVDEERHWKAAFRLHPQISNQIGNPVLNDAAKGARKEAGSEQG